MSAVEASEVVAPEWEMWPGPICPKAQVEPVLCDCGHLGAWERRWVYIWHDVPGHARGDKAIRKDMARGFPPRPHDEGWWIVGGWDERCPGCGDIERFDFDGEQVGRFQEQAKVIVFMDARRKA